MSPNAFLIENSFYNTISDNLKVKIVKENIMRSFQDRFDVLFMDPEFGFKADDKLISQVISSLSYEYFDEADEKNPLTVIGLEVVSTAIFFIQDGVVNVHYKNQRHPIVCLESGCYFGDVSFIF